MPDIQPSSPLAASESRELQDLLLSELKDLLIVLLDREGRFISWQSGVEELFGYSREEFLGQTMELLRDEASSDGWETELRVAAELGRTSSTQWLVTNSHRHIFMESVTLALRDGSGMIRGFGKVLRDITEQQHAEDSLAALARALDQSSVIVRQWNGLIDHWTAGCERLYRWSANEAVGKYSQQLLQTIFPAPLAEIENQLRTAGVWKGEVEQVRRDGTHLLVLTEWMLLSDSAEEPLTVIETHTDMTESLRVQRELATANERLKNMAFELERSNEELEQFARIASHDLSAPITSTRWLVDLLSSRHAKNLDEQGHKILTQISQGLDRMSDLVDAVLAHAQVGTSSIGSTEPISAEDTIANALDNLRKHVETSGALIHLEPLPTVFVERQALTQLFQNLISNAIKYRRDGIPPVIHIEAIYERDCWRFSVRDNGIGIEPEWYERVFQPMQRRHGSSIAGSGIGLATCKKIVTRVGGDIWVESQLGESSTFYFTLPGALANPEAPAQPAG